MKARTRVLTPLGIGSHDPNASGSLVIVELDQPFLDQKEHSFERPQEIFPFSDHALICVMNVGGVGCISNLMFYAGGWGAVERSFHAPFPPDETRILLHLDTGKVEVSQDGLNPHVRFMRLNPWIDRHARERPQLFDEKDEALAMFDEDMKLTAGTRVGIMSSLVIDVQEKELLRFCITVAQPQGIIYRWSLQRKAI